MFGLFKNRKKQDREFVLNEYIDRPWAWNLYCSHQGTWKKFFHINNRLFIRDSSLIEESDEFYLEPRCDLTPFGWDKIPSWTFCTGTKNPGAVYFETMEVPPYFSEVWAVWRMPNGRIIQGLLPYNAKPYKHVWVGNFPCNEMAGMNVIDYNAPH